MPTVYDSLDEDVLVNTTTEGNQGGAKIAALAGGGWAVVWVDANLDLQFQLFDAAGNKSGSERIVNTETAGTQQAATIAPLASGGFVVTWMDDSGTGGDASITGIKAQLFEADGDKVGGEFLVNTATLSSQTFPVVTQLTGGG